MTHLEVRAMSSTKLYVRNILLVGLFSLVAVASLSTKKVSAAVQLSTTFPDPNATSISTNNPTSPSPLYLTVGTGEFNVSTSGATILSDAPGNFSLRIDHAGWCNNDLDLPTQYGQAYKKTNFDVWSVTGSSGAYNLASQKSTTTTGYIENCDSTTNDSTLSFTMTSSDYNSTIKKYVAIVFGSQLYQAPNKAYGPNLPDGPGASENSFRFIISGPGSPGMTLAPPNTLLGAFYNFSNRNRSIDSKLTSSIILNTPCSLETQSVTIQFFDVDNGEYQSTGSGNDYNFPLNFSVKRSTARGVTPTIDVLSPTKINGGDKVGSQIFTITLDRNYTYEFKVSGLSKPNTLTFNFSTNIDPLYGAKECSPVDKSPIGYLDSADCSLLTGWAYDPDKSSSSATVHVYEGGAAGTGTLVGGYTADASRPDVNTAYRITGNHGFIINVPIKYQDGNAHTFYVYVLGTDSAGTLNSVNPQVTNSPKTIVCANFSCSFTSPTSGSTYEPGESISPSMKVDRSSGSGSVVVTPSATLGTTTLTPTPINATTTDTVTTATISFPGKTFVDADLNTGSFTITGTIKWPVGGSSSCSTTFSVVRKPFFNVTNGDLMVGGVYPTGSPLSCRTTSSGNLSSWANASNTLRQGAHVDLVAKVLGTALGVYSGNTKTSGIPNGMFGKWLTIANTSGVWGGGSDDTTCMKDFYTQTKKDVVAPVSPAAAQTVAGLDSSAGTSDQIEFNGNLEINGGSSFSGKLAVYVTGNVYISGDITMNTNYTNGVSSIPFFPFFALIVKGNVYVKSTVQRLDGVYVIQPKLDGSNNLVGGTGTIYTCASAANTIVVVGLMYSTCGTKLTFNGIVQAKDIKLHRTIGTLNKDTPAEVFNNLPELHLVKDMPFKDSSSTTTPYDSAISLPPLL